MSSKGLTGISLSDITLSVQLRPMVRPLGTALLFDVSLFERLYTLGDVPGVSKTMLDVRTRILILDHSVNDAITIAPIPLS